jgi:hypothetical protein
MFHLMNRRHTFLLSGTLSSLQFGPAADPVTLPTPVTPVRATSTASTSSTASTANTSSSTSVTSAPSSDLPLPLPLPLTQSATTTPHRTAVVLRWDCIVQRFFEEFARMFATSKKVPTLLTQSLSICSCPLCMCLTDVCAYCIDGV